MTEMSHFSSCGTEHWSKCRGTNQSVKNTFEGRKLFHVHCTRQGSHQQSGIRTHSPCSTYPAHYHRTTKYTYIYNTVATNNIHGDPNAIYIWWSCSLACSSEEKSSLCKQTTTIYGLHYWKEVWLLGPVLAMSKIKAKGFAMKYTLIKNKGGESLTRDLRGGWEPGFARGYGNIPAALHSMLLRLMTTLQPSSVPTSFGNTNLCEASFDQCCFNAATHLVRIR